MFARRHVGTREGGDEAPASVATHLEHVFQRIGRLLPGSHEMLVPFSHEKVEVLIVFSWYDTIVVDTFLVTSHGTPSVSVDRFQ